MKQLSMAIAIAMILAMGPVFAQDAPSVASPGNERPLPHSGMRMGMMQQLCAELSITQDQQDRLKAIMGAAQDWAKLHHPEQQEMYNGLAEQFKQDKMDEAKIDAIQQAAAKSGENARVFVRQTLIQVHDVLTPEQRAKAADKIGMLVHRFLSGGMIHPGMLHPPSQIQNPK